ncbi:MAG: hypoxanthine phosphoribosyltransferase [Clostridiales bacterium]|nr:MAG: hypoxanthine phosphoribosyltransferase [Clostridiales bacterium]
MADLRDNIAQILLSEEQIKAKVSEMAAKISEDYKDKKLLLVGILKGSMVFMADLMRFLDINAKIDFMSVSSYGSSTVSSGQVRIIMDLKSPVEDYDILLVEDILDSGATLSYLKEVLLARQPRSIRIATLLDKPARRKADISADYRGFEIPDEFVVGYGLDFNEDYRNLPFIGVLKPEAYS